MNNKYLNQGLILSIFAIFGLFISCNSKIPSYVKSAHEITIPLEGQQLKLSLITDDIIRVVATNEDKFDDTQSLIIQEDLVPKGNFEIRDSGDLIVVQSAKIKVTVDKKSGVVAFYDSNGNLKLSEQAGGRNFEDSSIQDWKQVGQTFESPSDEALFGLGQHQHGYMNFKGKDVDLTQHNIVAVVPFLYSNKKYGILWDNYSITRFGDPRPYEQMDGLELKDDKGKEGTLTEIWYKNNVEVGRKNIDKIDYQYLETPSYEMLPKPSEVDKIVFEGKISSVNAGKHKFLLYASNYFKLWIDDQLIFDKWRQNWNPWSNPFEVNMNAGEEHKLRIEWIPNSGYMSLTHLDPWNVEDQNRITFTSDAAKQIDYYYIDGADADQVIAGYRSLTGKSSLLPKSAYGFWQSRERYKTQNELLETAASFRKKNIPIDNIVLDWNYWPENAWGSHEFDSTRFDSPQKMTSSLEAQDIDIMISVWPKYYEGIPHYEEMKAKGYLFLNNIEKKRIDWIGKGYHNTFYDPFNEGARKMFWQQLDEHLFSKGFKRYWLDATEPDMHSNLSITDRIENMKETALGHGAAYFNAYSLMNSRGVYEGQMANHPDERVFILTRSAFAGQQRYGSVTWSGDIVSRWSDLSDQISAGINFSMSGIPNWTMDIGGFAVEDRFANDVERVGKQLASWRELNTRWFQFGAFCPLFRSHGQYPFREIFNIAPEGHPAYESMLYYNKLRYRLMPHIYSLAAATYFDDFTIMRGLPMDFGNDEAVMGIGDQYMFGKEIMVCPVVQEGAITRKVYLPKGNSWYDFYSGALYEGGQAINANSPYEKMPLFVKSGSIIAMGNDIQSTKQSNLDEIHLYVYDGANGAFTLYDDGGKDMSFKDGNHASIHLSFDTANKTIKFGERQGKFISKQAKQKFYIHFISKSNTRGIDIEENFETDVFFEYNGKEKMLKL